jgi:hypothetical protein
MVKVFISYRQSDSLDIVDLLDERLKCRQGIP